MLSADKTVKPMSLTDCCPQSTARRRPRGGQCESPVQPRIRRDYPLNLSISVGGGKETNQNSLSNGE